jgi:hypothetical protein
MTDLPSAPARGKTELKVKGAAFATFVVSLLGQAFLATTATDFVSALPDWVEVPAYSLLLTAVTWVAGYSTRNKPSDLSPSTITAVREWLEARMPRATR